MQQLVYFTVTQPMNESHTVTRFYQLNFSSISYSVQYVISSSGHQYQA